MEKSERWGKIAVAVGGKTRNQCMARYKFLKDFVTQKKKFDAVPIDA
jgi:hypothetical protein